MKRDWKVQLVFMLTLTAFLIVLLLAMVVRGAPVHAINVTAAPNEVDRNEQFLVTVSTAYPNTTFNLTISGTQSVLTFTRHTDALGVWTEQLAATFDFGVYTIRVDALNQTASTTLRVGCSARCVLEIQQAWGDYIAQLVADGNAKTIIIAAFLVLSIELPRAALYFHKQGLSATKHGELTAADALRAPLAFLHGFVQPGRMSMRQDVNDRIAIDLERRRLLEQLHDATQAKHLEYDPDHLAAVADIAADLKNVGEREARVTASLPPVAQKYERRPGEHSMATNAEFSEEDVWMAKAGITSSRSTGVDRSQDVLDVDRAMRRSKARGRYYIAQIVALVVGVPVGLVAVLGPLAYSGVYVEPFRSMWRPWMGAWDQVTIWLAWLALGVIATVLVQTRARAKAA